MQLLNPLHQKAKGLMGKVATLYVRGLQFKLNPLTRIADFMGVHKREVS